METNTLATLDLISQFATGSASAVSDQAFQYLRAGLEQLSIGEPEAALAAFNAVLERAPHLANAHVAAGVACAMTSRIYPAVDHLTRAAELEPGNFHAHLKLAQLYFKLRVPAKGYESARRALHCATTLDERRVIAQLLREERQRERNGIARPCFYKTFSRSAFWLAAGGTAAALVALVLHMH